MDLESNNIRRISEYIKTSLPTDNEGTVETHPVLPENSDYFSKIAQALNKVEQLLFNDYESNQNNRIIASECYQTSDITTKDTVKLLRRQVENLEQQLLAKESELQATQQELNYTNQELIAALKPDILTLAEAKELAKKMLVNKQPIDEYLAKLLSAIYNSTVEASELAPIDKIDKDNFIMPKSDNIHHSLNDELNELVSMRKTLKKGNTALRAECIKLRNKLSEIKARSKDIKARTPSTKNK